MPCSYKQSNGCDTTLTADVCVDALQSLWQVDLFFYREPEETRPAEEEEGLAAVEFSGGVPDFGSAPPLAGVPALADANWDGGAPAGGDWEPAAAPVAATAGGGDWTAAPGKTLLLLGWREGRG